MEVLSHRGWWLDASERNTMVAFTRSFEAGFGTETDVRDHEGALVISHDPPTGSAVLLREVLELHAKINPKLPLAINIKADGLAAMLASTMEQFQVANWFAFDMSVPDMVIFSRLDVPFFTRQSDIEVMPVLIDKADGIWVDSFFSDWLTPPALLQPLRDGKRCCIVSPELHGFRKEPFWELLKSEIAPMGSGSQIMLCSDFPQAASVFFNAEQGSI